MESTTRKHRRCHWFAWVPLNRPEGCIGDGWSRPPRSVLVSEKLWRSGLLQRRRVTGRGRGFRVDVIPCMLWIPRSSEDPELAMCYTPMPPEKQLQTNLQEKAFLSSKSSFSERNVQFTTVSY